MFLLASLHGASCDELNNRAQALMSQWNAFIYASSGEEVTALTDIPLRRAAIVALRRYSAQCR